MNNLSIRTNLLRTQNPLPATRNKQCLYLCHVSKLIRDTTGSGNTRTDSYFQCNKLKQRITKRRCVGCGLYKPIINE
jgi:hypothetical protein